jgi:hypothetical protein
MSVLYLDPRAEPGLPVAEYRPQRLSGDQGATIGLLANNFPDSVAFLDELETALTALAPVGTVFRRYAKPNASVVVSDQLLATITAECTAVVAAYGH